LVFCVCKLLSCILFPNNLYFSDVQAVV
jgi:hypothetical protein